MKKIIFILTAICLTSCGAKEHKTTTVIVDGVETQQRIPQDIEIIQIDGHDYIKFYHSSYEKAGGGICHSESCKCKIK